MATQAKAPVSKAEVTHELSDVEQWRVEKFKEMKFKESEARQLAKARDDSNRTKYAADTHQVKKMLDQGAKHMQIVRIFT